MAPYSPFRGNQLLNQLSNSVQQVMMMKKQQEAQDKQRQQELKDTFKKMQQEHKLQQELFQNQAEFEKTQRNTAMQEQIDRNMAAWGQVSPSIAEMYTQPGAQGPNLPGAQGMQFPIQPEGQAIMAAGQYGAAINQPLSPEDLLAATLLKPMQYQTQRDVAETRAQAGVKKTALTTASKEKIAEGKAITTIGKVTLQNAAKMARLKTSLEGKTADRALRKYIADQREGRVSSAVSNRARRAASKHIAKVAKDMAGKEPVTSDHYARAIDILAASDPQVWGEYKNLIEQMEPGTLNYLTMGLFGKPKLTLKGLTRGATKQPDELDTILSRP